MKFSYISKTRVLISLLLLSLSFTGQAQLSPELSQYHSVKAKDGDGIYALLRRYNLNSNSCNIHQFYKLNNLSKSSMIHAGRKYKLPVLIYNYNGRSIRSTLKIDDLAKAIRIKTYNEKILSKRLRRSNFIDSKILWVPHHELFCDPKTKNNKDGKNKTQSDETKTPTQPTITQPQPKEDLSEEKLVKVISEKKPKVKRTDKKSAKKATAATKEVKGIKNLFVPLFGKKHQNVTVKNNNLANQVYYVVSGHGGPDPGARCTDCKNTLCEDEYAYDVALRLARNLMSQGAIVHVIVTDSDGIRDTEHLACDTDEKCIGKYKLPRNQKLRLKQRSDAINDLYYMYKKRGVKKQETLSIHIDSNKKSKKMDAYFCYYKHSSRSRKMAADLQATFKKKYSVHQSRPYKGRIDPRGFYILKNTMPPAVLVELGNIKNSNNQKRFIRPSNRQALADWLFEGLTGKSI